MTLPVQRASRWAARTVESRSLECRRWLRNAVDIANAVAVSPLRSPLAVRALPLGQYVGAKALSFCHYLGMADALPISLLAATFVQVHRLLTGTCRVAPSACDAVLIMMRAGARPETLSAQAPGLLKDMLRGIVTDFRDAGVPREDVTNTLKALERVFPTLRQQPDCDMDEAGTAEQLADRFISLIYGDEGAGSGNTAAAAAVPTSSTAAATAAAIPISAVAPAAETDSNARPAPGNGELRERRTVGDEHRQVESEGSGSSGGGGGGESSEGGSGGDGGHNAGAAVGARTGKGRAAGRRR